MTEREQAIRLARIANIEGKLQLQCPHCQAPLEDCTRCLGEPLQLCAVWCKKNDVISIRKPRP